MAEDPVVAPAAAFPPIPPSEPKLTSLYVTVIIALSLIGFASVVGMIWISLAKAELPDGLIAMGSVAIGALAALIKGGE